MSEENPTSAGKGGDHFADALQFLLQHRGLSAEKALLEAFGETRFIRLLEGDNPSFREVTTIINVLNVPLNYFEQRAPTFMTEIETAYGALLYFLSQMDKGDRALYLTEIEAMAKRAGNAVNEREEKINRRKLDQVLSAKKAK